VAQFPTRFTLVLAAKPADPGLRKALAPGFALAVAAIGSGCRANVLVLPVCLAALAVGRYRSGMRSDMRVAEAPDPAIPALSLGRLARRSWPWVVALAIVLLVSGLLFGGRASWGDVATWVVAVTTLLALVAAAFAGIVAYKVLAVETRRDLLADSERIAAQAAEVAAWSGRTKAETFVSSDGPDTWQEWGAVIRNASGLPVYGLRVWFCDPADPAPGSELRTLQWYESPELTDVLPPGDAFVSPPREITKRRAAGSTERWLVAVEFTDAVGARWLREPRGKLTPVGQADPLPARHRREPDSGADRNPQARKAPQ
jgi:hypothetical protein